MQTIQKFLAASVAAAAFALPQAHAAGAGEAMDADVFVKMCDENKDGTVTKAEVMKQVEKMFDKADTSKSGKLDKKQVEIFLRQFMQLGGA